jgi:hypothetical protein
MTTSAAPDLEAFLSELENDVAVRVETDAVFTENALFEILLRHLQDLEVAIDLDTFHARSKVGNKNLLLVAAGVDPADGTLTAVVGHRASEPGATLDQATAKRLFEAGLGYIAHSVSGRLQEQLEESSRAYDAADFVGHAMPRSTKLRLVLVSDGTATRSLKQLPDRELLGVPVSFSIWDAPRFHSALNSDTGHEPIVIDLTDHDPRGIPCVRAGRTENGAEVLLFTLPGSLLAHLYGQHGSRLLESNIRGFLDVRGNVNKGIQYTLENHPGMFLAYNNGLTTTCTSARIDTDSGSPKISRLVDWQIVNGGQTTASTWYFARKHAKDPARLANLDNMRVQVKLVVVDPVQAADMVPLIALYANSQNKVSLSDFSSNSPYQKQLEVLSQRVLAPATQGRQFETRWFYERVRGAYSNKANSFTGSRKDDFLQRAPKNQILDKVSVARVENIWTFKPHVVSKGAQASFQDFTEHIKTAWERDPHAFHEHYYKDLVAKTILHDTLRRHVMSAAWYRQGYLANIVAYGLSKLVWDIGRDHPGLQLDLGRIWRNQEVAGELMDVLDAAAQASLKHLTSADRPQANVTQWAKQALCWDQLTPKKIHYPAHLRSWLVDSSELLSKKKEARQTQRVDNGIDIQTAIITTDPAFWEKLREFSSQEGLLTSKESLILGKLVNQGYVSEKEARVLHAAKLRAKESGILVD